MKRIFLSALVISHSVLLFAQQTKIVTDPDQAFLQARTDFYAQHYGLAYPVFQKMKKEQTAASQVNNYLRSQELDFFNIASALMLREEGADLRAKNFMTVTNNSVLEPQLNYYLGSYYFSKSNFTEATNAFEQSSIANLTNEQIAQKNFEEGYAWFTQQQFAKAKPLLNSVRQIPTDKNYVDANYYYGFIAFNDKNYRDALQSFQLVQSKGKFLNLVPFYITQIYYFQGQKDKAIAEAEKALAAGGQYYDLELRQLLGHAYFEKQEYAKALPLLETYVTGSKKVRKEDLYELSFCYYQANQLTKAIEGFKQLSSGQDTLSQNAMYLLGDAFLKTGQKKEARNAFLFCSTNSSNQKQKEISTFLLGKLSYELGYDNEALIALKKYNDLYFRGEFADECRELLVNVLANTNNYRDALTLYETLPNKSENNKRVYPRILYNRAQELTNDGAVIEADKLLEKAEKSDYNASLLPLINFWRGEIAFRGDRLTDATTQLNNYLKNPIVQGEANPSNANYILGYAALRNENYQQALQYFQRVKSANAEVDIDVQNRMADAYYMLKDFGRATELYNSVIARKTGGSDYATYQKAMIAGAQNRRTEKISLLKSIETSFPSSALYADAQMEAANAYLVDENYKDALPYLDNIIKSTNTESLKPQAYLKMGIAQYNLDKNNDALNTFKTLLQKYPQSAEAEDAIDNIRNIFVGQGKPDEYVKFIKSTGKNISYGEADSLTYTAANIQLSNGAKDKALEGFTKYLSQYPDGQYVVPASFNAAELLEEKKDMKNAVARYQFVADKAPNKFAERAMLIVARYNYFDLKDYAVAATYYQKLKDYSTNQENKLEARRGLLRCQYQLAQWADALPNAQEILATKTSGADDKIFAYMIVGKNAQSQNDCVAAMAAFKSVTTLSKAAYGAEARYEIANCLFQNNKLGEAEKAAFEVINKAGSYVDWVTRSYLLLGDIYLKQKDYFNAKATYKSVAENATIAEFKTAAQDKFKIAEEEEARNSKVN
ncbi:MAG: tetratricopeptide repeat protein [Chitinophagaceae bacterium]